MAVLKRQRELRKQEKAALKRERKERRLEAAVETESNPTATREDLESYGIVQEDADET